MDTDTDTDTKTAMELTRNPVDGTWGFICREHGIHRSGLAERHAHNVEAKHRREQHADPLLTELDLTAGAQVMAAFLAEDAQAFRATMKVWRAMAPHLDWEAVLNAQEPVRAAVVPF